ncbi:putative Fungal-specific transcription factor domain-containing protein [Seiridium cardinale]
MPACLRCRARKVKCDNKFPTCSVCERAGVECDQAASSDKLLIKQLENRIKDLEALTTTHAPDVSLGEDPTQTELSSFNLGDDGYQEPPQAGPSTTPRRPGKRAAEPSSVPGGRDSINPATGNMNMQSPSAHSSQIGPEQPLAHEVGLLSLGNTASEPKYLGPSSGFTLARLTYAGLPQSQGLPGTARLSLSNREADPPWHQPECVSLPSLAEMRRFIGAYVDAFHPLYPFLQVGRIEQMLEVRLRGPKDPSNTASLDDAMLFLVAALGARVLERSLNVVLKASNYLASAMPHVISLQLHESIQGVQVMLLLVLASFTFPGGLNAWFLSSAIIASCVDLGLQRRKIPLRRDQRDATAEADENIRSGVFWSAYSIDRTICTILGRPLNLRDEATDVDFPGELGTESSSSKAVDTGQNHEVEFAHRKRSLPEHLDHGTAKRRRLDQLSGFDYTASTFFFRFDRITAEIKLMLYRVAQAPCRFPWPTNHVQWQAEALAACDNLLSSAHETLSSGLMVPGHLRRLLPSLEIKYHQCILLLFRPTPAISQPSPDAIRRCYLSASEVLRIHAEQARFGELFDSWLTAHLVFVSGITMIYSITRLPDLAKEVLMGSSGSSTQFDFDQSVTDCSEALSHLGKTWSLARDTKDKFEKLAALAKETLMSALGGVNPQVLDALGSSNGNPSTVNINSRAESTQDLPPDYSAMYPGADGRFGSLCDNTEILWDELGDMSTWFDLTWVGDQNSI